MTEALYQQLVLDHARAPRHTGRLEGAGVRHALGDNPLCGDTVELTLRLAPALDARHETRGCAICLAAASVLLERVHGTDEATAREAIATLRALVTGAEAPDTTVHGALAAFSGLTAYPARHRCALLAARALEAALDGATSTVTTET